MARKKKLKLGVINIVLQPHSKERYIELIENAFKGKVGIKIFGQHYAMPVKIQEHDIKIEEGYILGKIHRYTEIDKDQPWLDIIDNKHITDENGKPIPQVDEDVKPNSKTVFFMFLIDSHRLVFDTDGITHNLMLNFFKSLFNKAPLGRIRKEEVTVNLETSLETIEEMLAVYKINTVDILINKPNPDDLSSREGRVKEKLRKMHASEMSVVVKSKDDELIPDEDTRILMNVAKSNGKVVLTGKDEEGKKVVESTESHPLTIIKEYTDDIGYFGAMRHYSFEIVGRILNGMK